MLILSLLLVANAALHGVIVWRFGIQGNEPPAIFSLIYSSLAMAAFSGWTYGAIATLLVTAVGLIGLTFNFRKLQHETTIEKIIFGFGLVIITRATFLIVG